MNATETQFNLPIITGENDAIIDASLMDGIIGQDEACRKLKFFIASHSETTPFPTTLFSGSQGLGKSYMASKIAKALGRELIEINCGAVETTKDFIEEILFNQVMGEGEKTLLLDESHKLSSDITTILLTFLNPNSSNKNHFNYKNWIVEYDFSKINIVFATTDAHKMFRPLLNRCVEVYFHPYSNEELCEILKLYLPRVGLDCDQESLSLACRGRARDAFLLSQNIKRYCFMKETPSLSEKGWKELQEIFDLHEWGLTSQEVRLLNILKDHGSISCRNLAIKMGVNENNVQSEMEIRPRELGLIDSKPSGRIITALGEKYLADIVNYP